MNLTIDWFSVLMAFGGLQGLIIGILHLKYQKGNQRANRFLGWLLLLFSYRLLLLFVSNSGLLDQQPWLIYFLPEFDWAFGPLLYLFVRSYIHPAWQLAKSDFRHFIPVAIQIVYLISMKLVAVANLSSIQDTSTALSYSGYRIWYMTPFADVITALLMLVYLRKSLLELNRYQRRIRQLTSNIQTLDKEWLRRIFSGFIVLIVLFISGRLIAYFLLGPEWNTIAQMVAYSFWALFTYWLGMAGYARRDHYLDAYSAEASGLHTPTAPLTEAHVPRQEHITATPATPAPNIQQPVPEPVPETPEKPEPQKPEEKQTPIPCWKSLCTICRSTTRTSTPPSPLGSWQKT